MQNYKNYYMYEVIKIIRKLLRIKQYNFKVKGYYELFIFYLGKS